MGDRTSNRGYQTDGIDDPNQHWLGKTIKVKDRPEWGDGRVLRWYPAAGGMPARLRIMCAGNPAPQVVTIFEVEVLAD